jgi:amino acid transporter
VKVPSFIFTYELFGYQTSLMAVVFISILAYLSSRASRSSKNANHLFTVLKMSLVAVIIFMAFANVGSENYNNMLNPSKGIDGVL